MLYRDEVLRGSCVYQHELSWSTADLGFDVDVSLTEVNMCRGRVVARSGSCVLIWSSCHRTAIAVVLASDIGVILTISRSYSVVVRVVPCVTGSWIRRTLVLSVVLRLATMSVGPFSVLTSAV